jgi:hypothetical protein
LLFAPLVFTPKRKEKIVLVQPAASLLAQLTAMVGTSGIFNAATIHLYTNNLNPTPQSDAGSFTECVSTGYASTTVTWGTPAINLLMQAEVYGVLFPNVFTDGGTSPVTIYGYYVLESGGALAFAESFATPFISTYNGQPLNVLPYFSQGQ